MEWLRWLLLAIGIVLIGVVYVSCRGWFRRRNRSHPSGLGSSEDLGGDWVGKPRVVRSADDPADADDLPDAAPAATRPSNETGRDDTQEAPPEQCWGS